MLYTAFDSKTKEAWSFNVRSLASVGVADNGVTVSIGLRVPDEIGREKLEEIGAQPMDYEDWKHSGCQSYCVRRGHSRCGW